MSRFLEALHSGPLLLMDGAMGTELRRAGLPDAEHGECWNVTHPERVRAIHEAYVAAGADMLLTNTFQGNPSTHREWQTFNRAAVLLARTAAGPRRFVLGDIGPIGPATRGETFLSSPYVEVARSLAATDALLLETFSGLGVFAGIEALREALGAEVPILLSLAYQRAGPGEFRTFSGHTPEEVARKAQASQLAALGVNCGQDIGMDEIIAIIRRYRTATDLPLFARPNAGTPSRNGQRWMYPQTPAGMADRLPELFAGGVCMIGGCCGTTPEHIAAFRAASDLLRT